MGQRTRTFKQQMFNAIDTRYKFGNGRQKHQDKKNKSNPDKDIIYSKTEHKNLKDMISQFDGWLKENHSELRREQIANFPVEVIEEFLETKKETCTQDTLESYGSRFLKAFRCAGAVYKSADFTFIEDLRIPLSDKCEEGKLRDIAIGRNLLEEALNRMDKKSGAWRGNKIASLFGARIDEIVQMEVRDVNFKDNTIVIVHGKGGKERVLTMDKLQREVMWQMCKDRKPGEKIAGVGSDAIHRGLSRALERIDSKFGTNFKAELSDRSTNTHAIRKLVSTEKYYKNLNKEYWEAIQIKLKDEQLAQQGGQAPSSFMQGKDISNFSQTQLNVLIRNNYRYFKNSFDAKEIRHMENTAWSSVSVFLGHGPNRHELKDVYVISNKTKIIELNK